ncbi:MAG: potassium channel family protein [Candidatus Eisenbacteria bacterium]
MTIWTDERGLSLFLLLLVGWVFVAPLLLPRTGEGNLLGDLFFSVLLLTGATAVPMKRGARALVIGVAVLGAGLRIIEGFWQPGVAGPARLAFFALSSTFLALILLIRVFAGGKVNQHRILGAVSVYLLIGVTWATVYALVEKIHPGSFALSGAIGDRRDWIYYSLVALTTTGFGDITPIHPVARTLTVFETLIGQLYPAILIARLVSQAFTPPSR